MVLQNCLFQKKFKIKSNLQNFYGIIGGKKKYSIYVHTNNIHQWCHKIERLIKLKKKDQSDWKGFLKSYGVEGLTETQLVGGKWCTNYWQRRDSENIY